MNSERSGSDHLRRYQRPVFALHRRREYASRSLDTLHVAAALVIQTVDFVTFDIRQAALAKLTGLKVRQ